MHKRTLRGAEWLRGELEALGLSNRELAELAGTSDATVRSILGGGRAERRTFARIATALAAYERMTDATLEPELHALERRIDELEARQQLAELDLGDVDLPIANGSWTPAA